MKSNESYTMTYIGLHAFFLDKNGRVLIIRRCPTNRYMPLHWDVPGGKKQSGEDIYTAIKREVAEETSLDICALGDPMSVYVNSTQLPIREDLQIVFSCEVEDTEKKVILNEREHDRYEWVDPESLCKYELMPYLRHCYEKVLKK